MINVQEIFLKVFNMSLTASIAILAVLLLRFFIRKAPKQYSYLLWGIVLFRLLCPISFQAPFSLLGLTGISANSSGEMEYTSQSGNGGAQIQTPAGAGNQKGLPSASSPAGISNRGKAEGSSSRSKTAGPSMTGIADYGKAGGTTASSSLSEGALPENLTMPKADLSGNPAMQHSQPLALCSFVWLLGMAVLGIYSFWSALRLRWQVACAMPWKVGCAASGKVASTMPWKGNIYLADYISSPFVLGIVRPRIYLPSSVHESECGYLVLHEQYHIRRRDYLVKPLAFFALCLHWMNPLAWLAFVLAMKDMEMSCDEAVVQRMGDGIRAEYARSLLRFAAGRRRISGIPLAFGEGDAKERIRNIMGYQKPAAAAIILAFLACLVGAACLGTNPASVPGTLGWARNLSQDEVESIALVAMPQETEKQYQQFSPEEWEGVVSLIRQSRGIHLASHEDVDGGSIFFYLTMKDGTEHKVGNVGNVYLCIDGDYYDAGYEWLSSWDKEYGEGNARLPEGFFGEEETEPLSVKFQAKVIELKKGGMLVEPAEGSAERADADRMDVPVEDEELWAQAKAGDIVEIAYNGEIILSDPAQLGKVYQITRMESPSGLSGKEAGASSAAPDGEGGMASGKSGGEGSTAPGKSDGEGSTAPGKSGGIGSGVSDGTEGGGNSVDGAFGRVQVSQEAYAAIWEAVLEHNGGVYEGTDTYDVACCSFAGLKTESAEGTESAGGTESAEGAESARGTESAEGRESAGGTESAEGAESARAESTKPLVTYYGWAYYGEYKLSGTGMEEVGASHVPVALTFAVDEDGCHYLKEYWEPSDGADFVRDIRRKFPPSIVEDGLDSQIFVERQIRECYAQAIASTQADAGPMVAHLLERICKAEGNDSALAASSNPADYIEAHMVEYRKLYYFGDETLKYCLKRFAKGGEDGLEGHIMAHACERLLEERWKMPIKASAAATGQEWYDALKAQVCGWEERPIAPGEEIPLSILKIGIPVQIAGGTGWAQERRAEPSAENHLEIQYYDAVLEAPCTFWAAKDSELNLPAIEYDPSREETWGAEDASGQPVTVRVQHAEGQALASWEHGAYKFAILADVPDSQADTAPVPKMALGVISQLE